MTRVRTADLVEALSERAAPVRPLASPAWRSTVAIVVLAAVATLAIILLGNSADLLARYAGRHPAMIAEMVAAGVTAVLAIVGAFALAVPGGSRRWLYAPLPSFALWVVLAGAGCFKILPSAGYSPADSADCLLFVIVTSLAIGGPLFWRLSRAHPLDPLPVAILGGLGSAAAAALLLQFFHPFAITVEDFAVHLIAVVLVITMFARANRKILAPTR